MVTPHSGARHVQRHSDVCSNVAEETIYIGIFTEIVSSGFVSLTEMLINTVLFLPAAYPFSEVKASLNAPPSSVWRM